MSKTYEQRFKELVAEVERVKDFSRRRQEYETSRELDDVLTKHVYTQPVEVPVHISPRSEPG